MVRVLNDKGVFVKVPRAEAEVYKALHAESDYTRERAVRLLPYKEYRRLIRRVARRDNGTRTGLAAMHRLDPVRDEDLLRYFADKPDYTSDTHAKAIAVSKLRYETNRRRLRALASDKEWPVRDMAVHKLDPVRDSDLLKEALHDPRWQVRQAAAEKLDVEGPLDRLPKRRP